MLKRNYAPALRSKCVRLPLFCKQKLFLYYASYAIRFTLDWAPEAGRSIETCVLFLHKVTDCHEATVPVETRT